MAEFGYTLMCEQTDPRRLVDHAVSAEQAGFSFAIISDHISPWVEEQGHAPNAWATLGAVAHATSSIELMTYVTCPTMRYHPVVVAQQAATVGLLSEGRFSLGLGTGENLNESMIGAGWPAVHTRQEMFVEAVEIIRGLFAGDTVTFRGDHFATDHARLFDIPEPPPRIGIAVSGAQSCELAGRQADFMIAVEPEAELGQQFDAAGGAGKARVGQLPISYDTNRDAAIDRAHAQFRWFAGGWPVNAELPTPAGFAAASQFVTKDDVAQSIPCGSDVEAVVKAVQPFLDAGFTHVGLVQVGDENQDAFFDWAKAELLPALNG